MIALTIWRVAILLELVVLYRGLQSRLLSKYPFFYLYVASVLLADSSLYLVRMMSPALYSEWNWVATLLNLILGYGIILEIFRHVLAPYPGIERVARFSGLIVLGLIFCFALGYPFVASATTRVASTVQIERDFWAVQAIFLFGMLGVIAYYGIVIGRNLKGMIFGYGLCLATTLMALAFRSYVGSSFRNVSNFIEPFSFLISLSIWMIALWSDHPNPVGKPSVHLEADYESLVLHTRDMIGVMRSYFTRGARS